MVQFFCLLLNFVTPQDVPGPSYTFPAPALESATFLRSPTSSPKLFQEPSGYLTYVIQRIIQLSFVSTHVAFIFLCRSYPVVCFVEVCVFVYVHVEEGGLQRCHQLVVKLVSLNLSCLNIFVFFVWMYLLKAFTKLLCTSDVLCTVPDNQVPYGKGFFF